MPPFLILGLGICFVLNFSLLVDDCADDARPRSGCEGSD